MTGSLSNSPEIHRRHSANVYPEHVGRLTGYLRWANNTESTTFSPPSVCFSNQDPSPPTPLSWNCFLFHSTYILKGHVWEGSDIFICACAIIFLPKYTLGHLVTVLLMQPPLAGADSRVLKCPGTAKSDYSPLRATELKIQHHGVSCTFN